MRARLDYNMCAHIQEEEEEGVGPTPIKKTPTFHFKDQGILFVRDTHNLQKKVDNGEELDKIRFDTCRLNPSLPYADNRSSHLCYARLPVQTKPLGVRAQINQARSEFSIYLDYVYIKTTKNMEENEPQSVKTFYLFDNQITYSESDIPYNDQYIPELKDDEYEISYLKFVGTAVLPQMYLVSQPYHERVIHVFAREFGKVSNWLIQ